MNRSNFIIGIAFALALIAAIIGLFYQLAMDRLLGAVVVPGIIDGVSSPEWFENIKPIEI